MVATNARDDTCMMVRNRDQREVIPIYDGRERSSFTTVHVDLHYRLDLPDMYMYVHIIISLSIYVYIYYKTMERRRYLTGANIDHQTR